MLFFPYAVCAVLTAILIRVLAPAARRINLVDYPSSRKVHVSAVPLIGGLTIFISIALSLLLFSEVSFASLRIFFFCLTIIVFAGVLDDHKDIPPHSKFLVQIAVAFILVVLDGLTVGDIGDIFSQGAAQGLGYLVIPFTIIAIVGVMNSHNMIDGYDGVCGAVTIISLCGLLTLFIFRAPADWSNILRHEIFILILLTLTSVSVFLIFNIGLLSRQTYRIFLGDAGSMSLGLILVFIIIQFINFQPLLLKPAAAPWILGLPLLDMANVIGIRLLENRSIFLADKHHLHHLLATRGITMPVIVLTLSLLHGGLVSVGVLGTLLEWPDWALFWAMPVGLVIYSGVYFRLRVR